MKGYYEILIAASAVQEIRSIYGYDPVAAKFILDSLEYLSTDLESGTLQTIDKETGLLKVAVGDFDALCWIRHEEMSVVILAVSKRRHPT
ncbi:type II toxin-antitoxin system RelE family toxin [Nonomuraea basaltis]|uniref:type II toxin-antitoxin system RelE family toxin n=1 Tax=Nonomuraea basaltis TaxID=2495887 RepID=UPI00110C4D9D|nr:hypothetical protein [Nonomuraea basaltis]TMR92598.1 hypothetical protein EJK15_43765 [Nonomuraea basaltis]